MQRGWTPGDVLVEIDVEFNDDYDDQHHKDHDHDHDDHHHDYDEYDNYDGDQDDGDYESVPGHQYWVLFWEVIWWEIALRIIGFNHI